MERLTKLLELFWAFLQIGPSTFGGGYAMIPVIEREIVGKRRWISEDEMADMVSLAGSAPGGVGVNAAAFVGYRVAGVAGAVSAVIGITLPTFLIILVLSVFYMVFQDHPKVEAALKGIHGAIIALIILAAYRMAKASIIDKTTTVLLIVTVGLLLFAAIHPIYVIMLGIAAGILLVRIKERLGIKVFMEKQPESDNRKQELIYPEYYI
ncbi:chromate transporter [Paenibacillus abyssi]